MEHVNREKVVPITNKDVCLDTQSATSGIRFGEASLLARTKKVKCQT